ncbi:MAG: hypothetical protein ACREHD_12330, partial [Pirellulales bacterium]
KEAPGRPFLAVNHRSAGMNPVVAERNKSGVKCRVVFAHEFAHFAHAGVGQARLRAPAHH